MMKPTRRIKKLKEGNVDRGKEHFELRYEPEVKFESDWNDWVPVAVVGPPKNGILTVQFVVEPTDPKSAAALEAVRKELQFYFFELKEADPWIYAIYHCGTAANIYSNVHWAYFQSSPSGDKRPNIPRKLVVDGQRVLFIPEREGPSGSRTIRPHSGASASSSKSEKRLPPRPQLQCPVCDFRNDKPERLAGHLIEAHKYTTAKAWFNAGQENERLYPRFRAPHGSYCVLAVDYSKSRGKVLATCTSLEDAVIAADQAAGTWPEITVQDESGKDVYTVPSGAKPGHLS